MAKSPVTDLHRRRYIANMTAINAVFSLIIGTAFYLPSMLHAGTYIPITMHPNPTVYVPSWLFIIQVADYFLLLSLWRNFYKMDKYIAGYRLFNWHVAMMTIIIIGVNQAMPFIALGKHGAMYSAIGDVSMVASGYGFLFWVLFKYRDIKSRLLERM